GGRRLASNGLHSLCDQGALPDVCRRDCTCPAGPLSIWSNGSQGWRCGQCVEFASVSKLEPPKRNNWRGARTRVPSASAKFLCRAAKARCAGGLVMVRVLVLSAMRRHCRGTEDGRALRLEVLVVFQKSIARAGLCAIL